MADLEAEGPPNDGAGSGVSYLGHNMISTSTNRISIYILAACLAVFLAGSLVMSPYSPDDTYITYIYAENLAHGNGLTFNVGEHPVEAYSNFLWVLICSLMYKLGAHLPDWAPKIGVLFGALNIVVLWLIFNRRQLPPIQTLLPLLLFASSGPFVLYSVSGMETSLFSLLLLAAMLCVYYVVNSFQLRWAVALGLVCVLLTLCRPEGIISFPIILFGVLYATKRDVNANLILKKHLVVASVVFLLLVIAYQLWRVEYFGELLPTPFLSKGGAGGRFISGWAANARYYFIGRNQDAPFGYYFAALFMVALVGLSNLYSERSPRCVELTSLLMTAAYMAVYVNFVDWMPGMRYHAALVGLLLIPGIDVQNPLFKGIPRKLQGSVVQFAAVGVAIIALSLSGMAHLKTDGQRIEDGTAKCLIPLGKWMKAALPSNALMAITLVGAVPYFAKLPTLDFLPESLTDLHIAKYGYSTEYVFRRNPAVVILVSFSGTEPNFHKRHVKLFEDSRFCNAYRLVGVTQGGYRGRFYWVFVRKDLEIKEEQLRSFPKGLRS